MAAQGMHSNDNVSTKGLPTEKELAVGYWLWVILGPSFIVFGIIGNVLSLLVLCQKKLRETVPTIYLVCLAIVDLLMLCADLMVTWLGQVLEQDIESQSDSFCKIRQLQTTLLRDLSAWILVVITIDRVIASKVPVRYHQICTNKFAYTSMLIIAILALAMNGPLLAVTGVHTASTTNDTVLKTCAPVKTYIKFANVWPVIHLFKSCILPIIIMSSGSILILAALFKKRNTSVAPPQSSANRRVQALSRLLLTLNFVFISTTAPLVLYLSTKPPILTMDNIPRFVKYRDPAFAALSLLNYLNHVLNFLLYCFTGSRFRGELKAMLSPLTNRVFPAPRDG